VDATPSWTREVARALADGARIDTVDLKGHYPGTLVDPGADPALYAMGRPGVPLRVNAVVVLCVYVPLLVILTQSLGPAGAGAAMLASSSLIVLTVGLWARAELAKRV